MKNRKIEDLDVKIAKVPTDKEKVKSQKTLNIKYGGTFRG